MEEKDVLEKENTEETLDSKETASNEEAKETKVEEKTVEENKETLNSDKEKKHNDNKKDKKNHYEVKIEKLEAEIKELKEKNKKDSEDYLAARADLDNIRKRLFEQSVNDKMYASQGLIESLIGPVDMLSKIVQFESPNPEVNNYVIGFKMIVDQLNQILEKDGVKLIKAQGEKFDAKFMQAMSTEKREGIEAGIVLEVLQNGYMYKDKMIKPAMVKVSE